MDIRRPNTSTRLSLPFTPALPSTPPAPRSQCGIGTFDVASEGKKRTSKSGQELSEFPMGRELDDLSFIDINFASMSNLTMKLKVLLIFLAIFAGFSLGEKSAAGKVKGKLPAGQQTDLIASINTACGTIDYLGPTSKLATDELNSIRMMISSLYDGGEITFTFPGGPKPTLNNESSRLILATHYDKENLAKLKGAELERRLEEIHSLAPDYHKHIGPPVGEMKKMLVEKEFRKRMGDKLVKLVEKRIAGTTGQGEEFDKELEARFGVKRNNSNLHTDENCHVGETLGAYH